MPKANPNPTVQIPSLEKSLLEENARQLAQFKPQSIAGPDDTGVSAHSLGTVDPKAHVSEKIYMFPESYNALRRELVTYWPNLWEAAGWSMAFKAELFVELMNAACDLNLQLDGNKVDATCKQYLNVLRGKRGISAIH
jgi:hypothetical protein